MIRLKNKDLKLLKQYKTRKGESLNDSPSSYLTDKLVLLFFASSLAIFILYPVFCLVRVGLVTDGGISFQYYHSLITGNKTLIFNSVFSSTLSAILSAVLSTAVALCVTAAKGIHKKILMLILLITMVSPPFISSLAYIQLYGRRGWITHGLLGLSLNPYNWHGVVIMQALGFAPMGALLLIGMIEKTDVSLLQSARDLGASASRAVRDVMLALISPGILAVLLLSFIRAMSDFGTPIVIGGRFETVASEIYMQVIGYSNLGYASALNMIIFIPAAFLFVAYRNLMKRSEVLLGSGVRGGGGGDASPYLQQRGLFGISVNILAGLFFIVMILQYACIFASGFMKSIKGKYYFTLEHLERLLIYDIGSILRSLQYALIVAVFGTLFSMIFAYYVSRRKMPFGGVLDFISTLPYVIPGTCFGLGYILAFNSEPLKLTGTAAIVMLNMMFRQLPNTTKLCTASLSQIPFVLEDAARDMGAKRLAVLRDVILPNLNSAFFTGFVYNFTSAMTTAGAILFLINPGQKIAVFRLFDAINTGEYGIASLISTCIIIITVAVNLSLMAIVGNKRQGGGSHVFNGGGHE